jgi:hypothetical protein
MLREIRAGNSLVLTQDLAFSLVLGPGGAFPDKKDMLYLKKGKRVTVSRNHQPHILYVEFWVSGTPGTFRAYIGFFAECSECAQH